MVAERFRRIWQLVELIAAEPGFSRKQLAERFSLSERQIQSDLNVVKVEMGLPLVRSQGYRFRAEDSQPENQFSLAEAQLLLVLLRRAARDPSLSGERMRALMEKLPFLFPLHLRPLIAKTMEAMTADPAGRHQGIFAPLAEALLRKAYVKLHYPSADPLYSMQEPIVQPDVLFPYLASWYVIGHCRQKDRVMVFDLDHVVAVTPDTGLLSLTPEG